MKHFLKIANAQAFWGDRNDAAAELVRQVPDLDVLTLDYLAEVSMSILAIQREKDPAAGYARDFLDVVRSLIPSLRSEKRPRIVANAGGLNPRECASQVRKVLGENDCGHLRVATVWGDDVLAQLVDSAECPDFSNLETGAPLGRFRNRLMTANAYLGAHRLAEAIHNGADIIVTGRVADPSLCVAPCSAMFGWAADDWNRLAGATVAGHLIECGTQATGGIYTNWLDLPEVENLGYPVAEIRPDGSCVITKPPGTGGRIIEEIIKEQLLYEIGDPSCYRSPDCTVSFLGVEVRETARDRVEVLRAEGRPPSGKYKVSATYRDGYKAEGMLTIVGDRAVDKARRAGDVILKRLERRGFRPERSCVEVLGAGDTAPGVLDARTDLEECVLRVAVADQDRGVLEQFAREFAPLVTAGPQGTTGYTSGRPPIRQVFGYWPCLIDQALVHPQMEILEVA